MHWLAQGLRKVQVEPSAVMATQNFKRNFCLNLYREGGKILTLVACFLLPLNRAIKNTWHLQPIFSIWRPLAFLPVTLSVLSGASPLLFSSSILDTWPGGLIFKCHLLKRLFLRCICCTHMFWETNSLRSTMQIVECSLYTLVGPRQSLLLARDPDQYLWAAYIP